VLCNLGAEVERMDDAICAQAPARWSCGGKARWLITCLLEPTSGRVAGLRVQSLSGWS
jgi:hypothetical protein